MNPTPTPILGVLLTLAAVAMATTVGWLIAAVASLVIQRVGPSSVTARATLLAQARLMPLTLVLVMVPAQVVGFARFEAGRPESAGPLLIALAFLGVVFLADACITGLRSWRQTRQIVGAWRKSAVPITLPAWARRAWTIRRRFPIVAVVGIVRPQLFVARQVTAECTPRELAAIAAHEAAHVDARDNLLRLLFSVTPAVSIASRIAIPLERVWAVAAEESADEKARAQDSGLELASALTKVARLAADATPEALPVSALIRSDDLEHRVRRLLQSPTQPRALQWGWIGFSVALVLALALQTTTVLHKLHDAFELLVQR